MSTVCSNVHEPEMRKGSTIPMAQISNITNISQMT